MNALRIKNKNINLKMCVWEQVIRFEFFQDGKLMEWQEKFFITAENENQAQKLINKLLKRRKKEHENLCKFKINKELLYLSEVKSDSSCPKIHSQIIFVDVL